MLEEPNDTDRLRSRGARFGTLIFSVGLLLMVLLGLIDNANGEVSLEAVTVISVMDAIVGGAVATSSFLRLIGVFGYLNSHSRSTASLILSSLVQDLMIGDEEEEEESSIFAVAVSVVAST